MTICCGCSPPRLLLALFFNQCDLIHRPYLAMETIMVCCRCNPQYPSDNDPSHQGTNPQYPSDNDPSHQGTNPLASQWIR